MEIIVEDIYSYIAESSKHPRALAIVREVCRARPTGFQYMQRYKRGLWDGYISLMYSMNKFPTGLLQMVSKRLQDEGYKLTFNVKSQYRAYDEINIVPEMLSGVTLRDYQINAIKRLLYRKRGIAKMATNAGKTEVMAGIIKALGIPKTLVLVTRKDLMYQTAKRFTDRLGISVGVMGDGAWQPETVSVAMIQTLHSKMKEPWLGNDVVMVDECHHLSSDTVLEVLSNISGAYRFGFSGTPLKYDVLADMKLIGATGRILVDVTNADLINQGYSAVPKVHIKTITGNDDLYEEDFQTAYKGAIVENVLRNTIIADVAKASTGVVLIIVNQIAHGLALRELIPDSVFVNGSDTTEYRLGVLGVMGAAKHGVFIASPIFDEGIDVPAVDTVILACGGKSQIKLLQRIGRGLRKKTNGNVLTVYDFIDDTNKYLLVHSERRVDTYVSEGFETILEE